MTNCRFTQRASELACVRRTGAIGMTSVIVVDVRSFAEIGSVDVPALVGWLWIDEKTQRRALVVQHDPDGTEVAASQKRWTARP